MLSTVLSSFPAKPPFDKATFQWLLKHRFYVHNSVGLPKFKSDNTWTLLDESILFGVHESVNITSKKGRRERQSALKKGDGGREY
jgi:hypothetical protein